MTTKNLYLKNTILKGLFVILTFLFSEITFAYQNHDLDEFDDLEKKSFYEQKKKTDNNNDKDRKDKQELNLFDDNLNLLNDDFDFDEEELELLKLELNPNDIETYREYESFLKAFIEDSMLVRLNSFEELSPPIIKQEQSDPISKTRDVVRKPTENRLSILPRLGLGLNYLASYNNIGFITGGSISYGNNEWGNIGADLMYIIIKQSENPFLNDTKKHTLGISGFYEKTLFKYIALKGGVGLLKTGTETKIGVAAGAGVSFPIGKILIIQPMARLNFGSKTNNMMGINLNIGISLEKSHLQEMFGNVAE